MPYRLAPDEMENLLSQSAEIRYQHFLDKVADWEEIWGVCDEQGWLVQVTTSQRRYITLWSHPALTEDAIKRHLPEAQAEEIDFEFLLEQWLPLLKQEDINISIQPDRQWQGIIVSPDKFEEDLRRAIAALD